MTKARKAADLFTIGVVVRESINHAHPFFPGNALTPDEALRAIDAGPTPLPQSCRLVVRQVLDLLVSPTEHMRGSASSNLRRLMRDGVSENA